MTSGFYVKIHSISNCGNYLKTRLFGFVETRDGLASSNMQGKLLMNHDDKGHKGGAKRAVFPSPKLFSRTSVNAVI